MTNRPSASDFLLLSLLFCLSHSRRGTSVLYDCKCKFSKQKRKQKQKYHKIIDYVIKCSGIPCVHFAFTLAVSRALYRHQCLICFVPQSQATLSKKLINILCVCVCVFLFYTYRIKKSNLLAIKTDAQYSLVRMIPLTFTSSLVHLLMFFLHLLPSTFFSLISFVCCWYFFHFSRWPVFCVLYICSVVGCFFGLT